MYQPDPICTYLGGADWALTRGNGQAVPVLPRCWQPSKALKHVPQRSQPAGRVDAAVGRLLVEHVTGDLGFTNHAGGDQVRPDVTRRRHQPSDRPARSVGSIVSPRATFSRWRLACWRSSRMAMRSMCYMVAPGLGASATTAPAEPARLCVIGQAPT